MTVSCHYWISLIEKLKTLQVAFYKYWNIKRYIRFKSALEKVYLKACFRKFKVLLKSNCPVLKHYENCLINNHESLFIKENCRSPAWNFIKRGLCWISAGRCFWICAVYLFTTAFYLQENSSKSRHI